MKTLVAITFIFMLALLWIQPTILAKQFSIGDNPSNNTSNTNMINSSKVSNHFVIEPRQISPAKNTTSQIPPRGFLKTNFATNNSGIVEAISGWDLQKGKGTLFMFDRELSGNLIRILLIYSASECSSSSGICVAGHLISSNSKNFLAGDTLNLNVTNDLKLQLSSSNSGLNLIFDLAKLRTWPPNIENELINLNEGQKSGPFELDKINADNVTGLNFVSYPVARMNGIPVTLHVGDSVSNGCDETLTLLKINNDSALFVKKNEYGRLCPI